MDVAESSFFLDSGILIHRRIFECPNQTNRFNVDIFGTPHANNLSYGSRLQKGLQKSRREEHLENTV